MLPLLQNETSAMDVCNADDNKGTCRENARLGTVIKQKEFKTKSMDADKILCELQPTPGKHIDDMNVKRRQLTISVSNTMDDEIIREPVRATNNLTGDEYHCRPHMCETCGKRFTLLENLNRHQMIHTDERPFICNYCKKRFRLAQHLKEHIRIHTGEKPYKCNTCGRAFCQISNLKSHQKTHTKIKAFKCDVCEKSFRRSFTLKQHKLTHTRHSHSGVVSSKGPNSEQTSERPPVTRKRSAPAIISTELNAEDKSRSTSYVKLSPPKMPPLLRKKTVQGDDHAFVQPQSVTTPRRPTKSPYISTPEREQPNINLTSPILPFSIVKQEPNGLTAPQQQTTSSPLYSYFPSLSALLSKQDVGAKKEGASSAASDEHYYKYRSIDHEMLRQYNSSLAFFHSSTNTKETVTTISDEERPKDASTDSNQPSRSPVSEYSCIQCNMRFLSEAELRIHVLNAHSRKDKRRDSAYSSHSDKSLPGSPNGRQNPVPSPKTPLHHAQDSNDVGSKREINASVMKRVTELAQQALMRETTPTQMKDSGGVQNISSPSGSENEQNINEDQRYGCPVVGHSPTEIVCTVREDIPSTICDSHSDRKYAKRESRTSQKWKRQLCQAWYEFPTTVSQEVKDGIMQKNNSESKDISTIEPQDTHHAEEQHGKCDSQQENNHSSSFQANVKKEQDLMTPNIYSAQYTDISLPRFTPIVEWKPVVTGWKDMVHGTVYAVPPHLAQPLLSPYHQAVTPNLPFTRDPISTPQAENRTSGNQENCTGNYFRFSPNFIQAHGFYTGNSNLTSPDNSNSPSGGSSVYDGTYWPNEPLPLSGYSRLQHGLLYQWNPNRIRLGGSSTVPSSANWVSAN